MISSPVKDASRKAGWVGRGSVWAAAMGLAVLATGGVALASDSPSVTGQIRACYRPGSNPSQLKVRRVPINQDAGNDVTVLTGLPAPVRGVYYLSASLSILAIDGDQVGCFLAPDPARSSTQVTAPRPPRP